jgi:hypothetical protein
MTGGEPEQVLTDLDPRPQEAILASRADQPPDRAISREADDGRLDVDVIAKLEAPLRTCLASTPCAPSARW